MNKIPRILSAPSPHADQDALDRFTAEGAPGPVDPRLRLVECPAPRSGPQRYRLPLWRFFGKSK